MMLIEQCFQLWFAEPKAISGNQGFRWIESRNGN